MKEAIVPIDVYEWLKNEWRRSNHSKYQHYFEEWFQNITQSQVDGFAQQKYRQESGVLAHLKPKTK